MASSQHTTPPTERIRERKSGVYQIRCIPTGKVYVGSAVWITKRWRHHREALAKGSHHSHHLQRAWNKYGPPAFAFEVLAYCPPEQLIEIEQGFIDRLGASDRHRGLNIAPRAGSNLGRTLSAETRAKLAAARTGKSLSAETKAKLRLAMLGNRHAAGHRPTPETLAKLKATRVGKTPALGMRHTDETKAIISAHFKGGTLTEDHRSKISASHRGKTKSPEHRARLSEVQARFNVEQVREIRSLYESGQFMRVIAKRFDCCLQTISNVINGKKAAYR